MNKDDGVYVVSYKHAAYKDRMLHPFVFRDLEEAKKCKNMLHLDPAINHIAINKLRFFSENALNSYAYEVMLGVTMKGE